MMSDPVVTQKSDGTHIARNEGVLSSRAAAISAYSRTMSIQPFHLRLCALARWLNQEQAAIIDYHGERNHQWLANCLIEQPGEPAKRTGKVVRESRLGGLLNHYGLSIV